MDAENGDGKKYYKENFNVFPYWITEKLELSSCGLLNILGNH